MFCTVLLGPTNPLHAQDSVVGNGVCHPGQDQIFVGGPRGENRIVVPSYRYLDTLIGIDFVAPFQTQLMGPKLAVPCGSGEMPITEGVFRLTNLITGPLALGDICEIRPKVMFTSSATTYIFSDLNAFLKSPYLKDTVLPSADYQAFKAKGYKEIRTIGKGDRLANYVFLIFGFIEQQCGQLPEGLTLISAMGFDRSDALYSPEFMRVEISTSANGWKLSADRLDRAQELQAKGKKIEDDFWSKRPAPLGQHQGANLAQFLEGLAVAMAGSRPGGTFDICNESDRDLRFATIALVPSSNPRVFVEGYTYAAPGRCARVSRDEHPMIIWGVAVQALTNNGWDTAFYAPDTNNSLGHKFEGICVPDADDFLRNETGAMKMNPCRSGDHPLLVNFNVRVGTNNYTLNLK